MLQHLFKEYANMKVLEGNNLFQSYEVIRLLGTGNNTVYAIMNVIH